MSWDEAIGSVKDQLPRFNDYLLKDYREEQVNRFDEFIHTVFQEAIQLFNGDLKYHGYRVLSPEKRIAYNIENGLIKGRVNIQKSELKLLEFMFEYENQMIPVYLYLPYLHNHALVINDTKFYIKLAIIDKMIFRVTDGVIVKVMRSPLQFWRTEQITYTDTEGNVYYDAVITVKAHYRKEKASTKVSKTPVVLYILSIYDFDRTTKEFGLPPGSISFTNQVVENDKIYTYFKCNENIFLKVEKEVVMHDISFRRFVASILYILKMVKRYTIADLYNQTFYKMILGKNLYGMNTKEALAAGHAESHLDSLKSYLDRYTKKELEMMRIYCDDVFALFIAVFFNIDNWLINYSPNDLFDKRIGGADLILMGMVKSIFTRFYDTLKKNKVITIKNIRSMLKMDPMRITGIWKVPSLQPNNALYNDNVLIGILLKKIRQSSTQENASKKNTNLLTATDHQFHPSFAAIEALLAIPSSSPGIAGEINPYAVIDKMGYFNKKKMPWYKEIEGLSEYLVKV